MELHYPNLKTVLITGGAGGIGSAIALDLLSLGATVLVIDNDIEGLDGLKSKSQNRTGELIVYDCDLADTGKLKPFFLSEIAPIYDEINTLICCAGIHAEHDFLDQDLQEWRRLYAINLESCFILSNLVGHKMIETRVKGSIILISSIHSYIVGGTPAYSSSKAAVDMLSKELAYSFARFGIRVNTVAPGSIDTPLLRKALNSEALIDKAGQRIPLGRLGRPEEVASLVLYLLSEEAAYVTGAGFVIDGGLLLGR